MSRILRVFAYLCVLCFATNGFAAGYTCPTYQKYTSCQSGYYMAESATTTSTLWYNVYPYNGTPVAGNKCIACPSQYSSFVSCPGGTKPPLYKISINSVASPNPATVYVIYAGLDGKVYSDADAENEITSWTPGNIMGNRTFAGVYASSGGSGTKYINADGTFTDYLLMLRPTSARTFYANNTLNTYSCSAGQYLKCANDLSSCACATCPGGKYCAGGTFSAPSTIGVVSVGITGTLPAGYYATGGASVENPTSCAIGNGECGSCGIYDDNTATGKTKKSDCTLNVPSGYRVSTVGGSVVSPAGNWWTTAHTVSLGDISEVNYCMDGYTINSSSYAVHTSSNYCTTTIPAGYGKNTPIMTNITQVRLSTSATSLRIKEFGVYTTNDATGTNIVSGLRPTYISNGASYASNPLYATDGDTDTITDMIMSGANVSNPLYATWTWGGANVSSIKFQLAGADLDFVNYPNIRIELYDVSTGTWHTVYYNSGNTLAPAIQSENSTGSIVSVTGPTVACGPGKYNGAPVTLRLTGTAGCSNCSALTGIDSSVSGTYSSVSPYNAATTCRFTPATIDVPDNCATYTPNTVAYDGTAWDSSYYTATANYGYNVVYPTDSVLPACTAKTTTISFNKNGGTGGQSSSITGTYDSVLPTISTTKPTKTGCKFMGWYDMNEYDDPDAVQYYAANGTPAVWDKISSSATLYAGWLCDLAGTANSVSQTYNGQPLSCAGVSGVTPSGATVTYSTDGTNFSTTIPTITDVSESGDIHYKISATDYTPITGVFSCVVTPATMPDDMGADNEKVYDGTALTCDGALGEDVPDGSTIKYGLSSGSYTLTSAPTITNVPDSKNIYYQVTNDNYNTKTGWFKCNITKADMDVTATAESQTYNGNPLTCDGNLSGVPDGSEIMYGTSNGSYNLTSAPTITNVADSTTIHYQVKHYNYNTKTGSFECRVTPADMNVTATADSQTYNGNPLTCDGNLSGVPSGSEIMYGTSSGSYTLTSAPTITNVPESKTIYYQVTNPNYNDATGSFACTVNPADMNVTATADSQTYNGSALTCDGNLSGVPDGSEIMYGTSDGSYTLTSAPTITNVPDSKTIYYQVTNPNYNDATGSFECVIEKAENPITLSADSEHVPYGGRTTVNVTNAQGSLSVSSNFTSVATATLSGTQVVMTAVTSSVAKAVITVTAAGNDNYLAGSKSYTLYVDQGLITLDPGDGAGGTSAIYQQNYTNVWLDTWNGVTMTPNTNPITPPRRNGYAFAGYYADANSTTALIGANGYITSAGITAAKAAKSNITWVAKWDLDTYNITYNLDGGTNDISNPATYNIESAEIVFVAPTRNFYTFGGWYLDSNFVKSITSIPAGSTGDMVLYAKWTANQVSVNFNQTTNSTYGVGDAISQIKCTYDETLTLPDTPTNAGYEFLGWSVNGTLKAPGAVVPCTTESLGTFNGLAFYVKRSWSPRCNAVTLSVDLEGATAATPGTLYKRTGDDAWYSDGKCNTKITSLTQIPTSSNATFGTCSYDGGACVNSSGALLSCDIKSDVTLDCTMNQCMDCASSDSVNSCEFTGVTNNTCQYSYTCNKGYHIGDSENVISGVGTSPNPTCAGNTIVIDYQENGGTTVADTTCIYGGESVVVPGGPFGSSIERTGYIFDGWSMASGNTTQAFLQCNYNALGVYSGTAQIPAKWTPITYTVEYVSNCSGFACVMVNILQTTCTYDTVCQLEPITSTGIAGAGHKLLGWSTQSDGTPVTTVQNLTATADTVIPMYAIWDICPAGSYHASTTASNIPANECTVCANNTYSDVGAQSCFACNTGYTATGTAYADHATSDACKITCGAGQYIPSAGEGCVSVGAGYWCAGGTVSQTGVLARNACANNLTTIGYGTGANEAGDCGRIFNYGDQKLYLRSAKRNDGNPALHVQIGDTIFYGTMQQVSGPQSGFNAEYDGKNYMIINDNQ